MSEIILLLISGIFVFMFVIYIPYREIKYMNFYFKMDKLCFEYNLWQINNGIFMFDPSFENAFDFCRSKYKYPHRIPIFILLSFKSLTIVNMLTNEMKQKFSKYPQHIEYFKL